MVSFAGLCFLLFGTCFLCYAAKFQDNNTIVDQGEAICRVLHLGVCSTVVNGQSHTIVLTKDGAVWTKGKNEYGQLGDGTKIEKSYFVKVIQSEVTSVAAGAAHTVVVKKDGSLWGAGMQIGDGKARHTRSRFTQIIAHNVKSVAAGRLHTVVLKYDGSVWTAGFNRQGQLGCGKKNIVVPGFEQVVTADVHSIAASGSHTMILKDDGSVWASGENKQSQLGDGTSINRNRFVKVMASGALRVSAGFAHSIILKQDTSVWAAGSNFLRQFGPGNRTENQHFQRVFVGDVQTMVTGSSSTILLKRDGSAWATGHLETLHGGDTGAVGFKQVACKMKSSCNAFVNSVLANVTTTQAIDATETRSNLKTTLSTTPHIHHARTSTKAANNPLTTTTGKTVFPSTTSEGTTVDTVPSNSEIASRVVAPVDSPVASTQTFTTTSKTAVSTLIKFSPPNNTPTSMAPITTASKTTTEDTTKIGPPIAIRTTSDFLPAISMRNAVTQSAGHSEAMITSAVIAPMTRAPAHTTVQTKKITSSNTMTSETAMSAARKRSRPMIPTTTTMIFKMITTAHTTTSVTNANSMTTSPSTPSTMSTISAATVTSTSTSFSVSDTSKYTSTTEASRIAAVTTPTTAFSKSNPTDATITKSAISTITDALTTATVSRVAAKTRKRMLRTTANSFTSLKSSTTSSYIKPMTTSRNTIITTRTKATRTSSIRILINSSVSTMTAINADSTDSNGRMTADVSKTTSITATPNLSARAKIATTYGTPSTTESVEPKVGTTDSVAAATASSMPSLKTAKARPKLCRGDDECDDGEKCGKIKRSRFKSFNGERTQIAGFLKRLDSQYGKCVRTSIAKATLRAPKVTTKIFHATITGKTKPNTSRQISPTFCRVDAECEPGKKCGMLKGSRFIPFNDDTESVYGFFSIFGGKCVHSKIAKSTSRAPKIATKNAPTTITGKIKLNTTTQTSPTFCRVDAECEPGRKCGMLKGSRFIPFNNDTASTSVGFRGSRHQYGECVPARAYTAEMSATNVTNTTVTAIGPNKQPDHVEDELAKHAGTVLSVVFPALVLALALFVIRRKRNHQSIFCRDKYKVPAAAKMTIHI